MVFCTFLIAQSCIGAPEPTSHTLRFRERFIIDLAKKVPDILKTQDPKTGRFGSGIWIVNDQNIIFPLAVAWATKSDNNPHYHDPKLLEAIMAGGDALIDDQARDGQWLFRKKDGSTWGMTFMPWTYSRWIRAFGLIRQAMPVERRQRWEKALLLGYTGISKTQLHTVHNIPTHHAMGLYIAGQVFNNAEWRTQAKDFMAEVVAKQDPGGFWSEHNGPVVVYNFVYSEALGIYYAASKDRTVLHALERAGAFHSAFVYPNGANVETIDERNPYSFSRPGGNVGFTFTAEGRGYLQHQWNLIKAFSPDVMAEFIMYGEEGEALPTAAQRTDYLFVSNDDKSMIRRKGSWFISFSGYHCPVFESRWIQDRQNFVSIFHDKVGAIVGGGNTKLQPLWSNFTVGDTSLLTKVAGETNPKFTPPDGLVHLPSKATLQKTDPTGIILEYDKEKCSINVEVVDDDTAIIKLAATSNSGLPSAAHLTLIPRMNQPFVTERSERVLNDEEFTVSGEQLGSWIQQSGYRLAIPAEATVKWPVLPHNPYTKDGYAKSSEGRIVVSLPFSREKPEYKLTLSITKPVEKSEKKKEQPMIWANLMHLSYNMWFDREAPELTDRKVVPASSLMRFDKSLWDDMLVKMAENGVNMLVIDVGDGVKYKSHPEVSVDDAWSIKQLKEELAKIRALGIEPIPKLNFSATHDVWLGPYSRMVSTPQYYKVCGDLIRECIEIFDKPRFFHLGMDEETYGHQLHWAYVVIRQYDLWWHDFDFLVEQVEKNGSRAWIWSDYIWNHQDEFLERMPKSVLQSNWYYGNTMEPENPNAQKYVNAYKVLDANGFDQIPTGSNWSNPVNFGLTVKWAKENIAPERLKGFLQTPWKPTTEEFRQHHIDAIEQIGAARKEFEK